MATNPYMYNYGYGYNTAGNTAGGTNYNYRTQQPAQQQQAAVQQQSPQQQYGVGYGQQQQQQQQQQYTQQRAGQQQQQQVGYTAQQQKPAAAGYQAASYQQAQTNAKNQSPYITTTNTVTASAVAYPATNQSYTTNNPFSVSGNNYFQKQQQQQAKPQGGTTLTQQSPYPQTPQQYTPQQAQVIQDYIKKQAQPGGGAGGKKGNWWKANQGGNQQTYYCEICKISCVSTMTYKTHLEGKAHKKKAAGPSPTPSNVTTYRCDLCDVVCTSKDAIEAHFRGAKHQKVAKLHQKLGKPVPPTYQVTTPKSTQPETVTVPPAPPARITFVGGKKLSMGGQNDNSAVPTVYPPASAGQSSTASDTSTKDNSGGEPDVEPVGLQLVVAVFKDAKYPHAKFKCEMCDCYFNDEFAKVLHCKGRRHRLNYKKTYQPDLKVEPTKQMKQQMEKKRKKEQERRKSFKAERMQQEMGHPSPGFYPTGPGFYKRGGGFHNPMMAPRRRFRKGGSPQDDKLVLNKHSMVYPTDEELKEVQAVMGEIEKALKQISDVLLEESCAQVAAKEGKDKCADMPVKKDEKMRELMGVMRVGALARGLMLRGERQMEVVLMMKNKPTEALLDKIASLLPERLLSSESASYTVAKHISQSALLITANYPSPLTVLATLTCTEMREQVDETAMEVNGTLSTILCDSVEGV
ncbi:zinc finger RNA-binding protein-like isoform X2 [Dysidea avara]|uniref:zinc finger RNA-binding protein-like isoform X2 n=1 Tax=Dysidea avara TaxID=196820 RepID=UPI003317731D